MESARGVRSATRSVVSSRLCAEPRGDPQGVRRLGAGAGAHQSGRVDEASSRQCGARRTEQELGRVREEQKQVRDLLDQLTNQRSSVSEQEIGSLNTAIASVRSQGGPGLEAWETRAAIDEIRDRYDLATWGAKGTALV